MLDKVLHSVRRRLPEVIARQDEFCRTVRDMPPPRSFSDALTAPGLSIIAEFKRASPSKGVINAGMVPGEQAASFQAGGASAISVLTEPDHFLGDPDDLRAARQAVTLPILRKDFTLDPAQVWETRAMGADAVLLIVSLLEDPLLSTLIETAAEAGLTALVEVHDRLEAKRATAAGATVIGVNNRDLRTFRVDLATSERIAPLLGEVDVRVAESGVHGPADAARLRDAGYDAVLVGEYLSRAEDAGTAVRGLKAFS
jgi:indole-3-glycerol phosphate synthase